VAAAVVPIISVPRQMGVEFNIQHQHSHIFNVAFLARKMQSARVAHASFAGCF
jgi:hypothetical protein